MTEFEATICFLFNTISTGVEIYRGLNKLHQFKVCDLEEQKQVPWMFDQVLIIHERKLQKVHLG